MWEGASSGSIDIDLAKNNFPGGISLPSLFANNSGALTNDATPAQVIVSGNVLPVFQDSAGNQLGIVGDQFTNSIPGASINVIPMFNPDNPGSTGIIVYQLPMTATYTLQAYAPNGGVYTVTTFTPSAVSELNGLDTTSGSTDELTIQLSTRAMGISSNGSDKSYCYYFADDSLDNASRSFNLCTNTSVGGQSDFGVSSDSNRISYANNSQSANFTLTIAQTGVQAGSQIVSGGVEGFGSVQILGVPGDGPGGKNWVMGSIIYLPILVR